MTIEIEPAVLAEIKEHAKNWLDYETQIHERVLKEKRWDFIDIQAHTTMHDVCLGSIAHRIMEILYPEEYHRVMRLMLDALTEVKGNEENEEHEEAAH